MWLVFLLKYNGKTTTAKALQYIISFVYFKFQQFFSNFYFQQFYTNTEVNILPSGQLLLARFCKEKFPQLSTVACLKTCLMAAVTLKESSVNNFSLFIRK